MFCVSASLRKSAPKSQQAANSQRKKGAWYNQLMRRILQGLGKLVHFFAWPAYWIYYKLGHGRTRVVLMRKDGKILVMKQWISSGKWILPGGGLSKGEPAADGALRELYEEAGLQLERRNLLHVGRAKHRDRGLEFEYEVFACKLENPPSLRPQHVEISELKWTNISELTSKNTTSDALNSIEMARRKGVLLQ